MVVVNIEVISDIVCVWCYIGKRTLDKAISLYQKTYPEGKHDIFNIKWRPYYLNPNPPRHPVDKREATEKKLSGMHPDRVSAITQHVTRTGHALGIDFQPGGRIGSTRDAHRLIHLCQTTRKSPAVQNALVDKLFEAYHEREMDISSSDVLREIAIDAGIDRAEVEKWLDPATADDFGGDAVDAEAWENRREGGEKGVPRFVIQGKERVSGAQDSQVFLEVFVRVKEEEGEEGMRA